MSRPALKFRRVVVDADPPGAKHDITLLADLTGNGRPDIIIGGKEGDVTLFWYENPSWRRHDIASVPNLEAGGVVLDVNRDGRPDIVAGQQLGGHGLYWFECPPDPRERWTPRVIEDRFEKYHDQAAGDMDGDGEPEVVFLSQVSGVLAYCDIPDDARVAPWPRECVHVLATDMKDIEGLIVADLDGDGREEILAGLHVFRCGARGRWQREALASGFVTTRLALGDLDGDGRLEVVVCEGESHPARLAWCAPFEGAPHILRDDLFHPHSLAVADFDGDGRPDIFVAEMGLGRNPQPRMLIYRNLGGGRFEEVEISRGVPTHEAKVADLDGGGLPDIVGKPYHPERHIDVWFNETLRD